MVTGREIPADVLAHELAAEAASALGRAGRKLEGAVAAFEGAADDASRRDALARVAEAAWELAVQREAVGLRDARAMVAAYRVPPAAFTLAGITRRRR